jgi:hypothetical protein
MKFKSDEDTAQNSNLRPNIGKGKNLLSNYHFFSKTEHTVIFIVLVNINNLVKFVIY